MWWTIPPRGRTLSPDQLPRSDWDLQQIEEMISLREKAVKAKKIPVVSDIDFHHAIARSTRNPLSATISSSA